MSVILVGLNHRTTPVEMLERVAVPTSRMVKAVHDLASRDGLDEVVLLSTCNRTEVYASGPRFHAAVSDVVSFLGEQSGAAPEVLAEHLYTYHDEAAVGHLFDVAAGIDSMILGEGEILGQVRRAWDLAGRESASGPVMARLFRHALEVGKRARSETAISRHALSVSSAAVALADRRMFSLRGRRVLVLGAGEMARGMALALASAGVDEIVVANRTYTRAVDLARRVDGRAITLDETPDVLVHSDVLLSATDSTELHLGAEDVEAVMDRRGGTPLLIVDVAVPRDVDPGVRHLAGVTLLDMDDLKDFTARALDERRREVDVVKTIVTDEMERFRTQTSVRAVAPTVRALRDRAESIRIRELKRYDAKLANLTEEQRAAVVGLTKGIVNKLLHEPTVRAKDAAGTSRGDLLVDALIALFDLSEPDAAR